MKPKSWLLMACSLFFLLLGNQLTSAGEGSKIAFSKIIGDKWQIVVTDENGQNQQNLSKNNNNDYEPSWSFDGRHIAFVSDRDGASPRETSNIYIMDADGSNQRQVTKKNNGVREHYPSFLPDGKRLIFTRETGFDFQPIQMDFKIYTIDIDGRNEKCLADGCGAKWSPDGKKIVFLPFENGSINCIITTIDADGQNEVKIAKGSDPSWSLDGKYIAFSLDDKNRLWEIYKMDSDGKNGVCLTNAGPSWLPVNPSWSPDGKQIVFWDRVSNVAVASMYKIYKVSADGGDSVPISEGGCMSPSWFDPAYASFAVNPLSKISTLWGKLKEK